MSDYIPLGERLQQQWEAEILAAEALIADHKASIARMALIYSGQLSLSVLEDDIKEEPSEEIEEEKVVFPWPNLEFI